MKPKDSLSEVTHKHPDVKNQQAFFTIFINNITVRIKYLSSRLMEMSSFQKVWTYIYMQIKIMEKFLCSLNPLNKSLQLPLKRNADLSE